MKSEGIAACIGNTPLVRLKNIEKACGAGAQLYAKLEFCNPTGSAKDRAALQMVLDAEQAGRIGRGSVIIEPTSGNTGIGLAAIGAARGYRVILTMPETMSEERKRILRAYGAQLVLTPGEAGMAGAIARAQELARETAGSFLPDQFSNPSNARAHYLTTGREIWQDMDGRVDCFVSAVGTGGTLTGVGRYLKEQDGNVKVVAVEPVGSPVLSGGKAGRHAIQGIGAGFVPKALDVSLIDEVLPVSDEDAFARAKLFGREEGFLAGISSGAALHAALQLAARKEYAGGRIVLILPDSGDRYYSTPLFD